MTLQFCSDLHLEFPGNRDFLRVHPLVPRGDILVIAGDAIYLGQDKMAAFPFFDWCADHFSETLIVPGNHEFYGGFDIADTLKDYELKLRPNVRYLNNRSWREGDVELFFTTLWVHYDYAQQIIAQNLMNDYTHGFYRGMRFDASDVNGIHKHCTDWLAGALDASDARKKVVVTHHCPIIDPDKVRFLGTSASPSYMTDMTSFIETHRPDCWIHGHVHLVRSDGIRTGPTTVYSNPLGYVFDEEHAAFDGERALEF